MLRWFTSLLIALSLRGAVPPACGETVAELRALSFDEASAGRQVGLSGVVTYLRDIPSDCNFSLHDGTGGVMVYPAGRPAVKPGQRVSVRGVTAMSVHGLRVAEAVVEPGEMGTLPAPIRTTMAELREGRHEGQFVEAEGIIRAVRLESPEVQPQRLALDFGSRARRLTVWVSHYPDSAARFQPGATVRVRGVVVRWRNPRGQPQSLNVLVDSADDIAGLAVPGPVEVGSLRQTQTWDGSDEPARRVRLRGTVTFAGAGMLVIQQDGRAMRVRMSDSNPAPANDRPFVPGEVVEAGGFLALGGYTVELEDAQVFERSSGTALAADSFSDAAGVLATAGLVDRDARLISLPGTLDEIREHDGRRALELHSAGVAFTALLPLDVPLPAQVRAGSQLRLTGICTLQLTDERRRIARLPDAFALLLRGVDDIEVVRAGPWWTPERLRLAMFNAVAALVLLAAWAGALRAKNRRLRREIAARERAECELSGERRRISAELHDTLEQTLTAASLQLNAASRTLPTQPETAAAQVALAHQLIARGRQEVRDAVWDLRLDQTAAVSPAPMLQRLCEESSAASSVRVHFQNDSGSTPLPAHIAAQLLRIAREAINNALKHAAPGHVRVALHQTAGALTLTIANDGAGFDINAAPGPETGHFGLSGMRERIERLGGTFTITSSQNSGSSLTVKISTP